MHPINYINKGLYSGEKLLESGQKLYFGFEKVDRNNLEFWRTYEKTATCFAESARTFCQDLNNSLTYPNTHSDYFCLSRTEFERVARYFRKKEYTKVDKMNPFKAVDGGLCGMEQVLQVSRASLSIFVAYASKTPVRDFHAVSGAKLESTFDHKNAKSFNKLYGDIVMSYIFISSRNTPTVTHYGIFRNPLDFFDVDEKYRGISMLLHGFGATVVLTQFQAIKRYMITTPMSSMSDIFMRSLTKGLFMGTNQDLVSPPLPEHVEQQKKFPPIYHIDSVTNVHKLADPGTDLNQYLDTLPDECTDLVEGSRQQFDNSGWTTNAIKVVVSLEELSKLYVNAQ